MNADDERLGQLFKALRRQAGFSQEQMSMATGIPIRDIHWLESGRVGDIPFGRVRRLFTECDARARIAVWWRGAAADRLLDEEHASIGERAARRMARYGWDTPMEVTFAHYADRGSIDIFAHRRVASAVAVCEVKSVFGSLEELNRTLDMKVRLAPRICRERFGWTPAHVSRLLIVPEAGTIRRVVAAHAQTMQTLYPARGREIHEWLRRPDRPLGGIWFLSDPRHRRTVVDRDA